MSIVPRGLEGFSKSGNSQKDSQDSKIAKKAISEKDEPVSPNCLARRQPFSRDFFPEETARTVLESVFHIASFSGGIRWFLPVDMLLIHDFEPGVSEPFEHLELVQERIPRSLFALDRHELGPIWILDKALQTQDIRTFDVDFQVVRNSSLLSTSGKAIACTLMSFDGLPANAFLSAHAGLMVPQNRERLVNVKTDLSGLFGDGSVDHNEASVRKVRPQSFTQPLC